jgi:hypothetical protein
MNISGNNQEYNYHQLNCLLIFIKINYMAKCFGLVICRPVCDITIKLLLEIYFTVRPISYLCFDILG